MKEYKVIVDGDYQVWYLNGKRHREDGPAYINGDYKEWWLNGEQVTEEGFNKRTTKVKEMTMEELCKTLGYNVKIIK